MFDTPQGPQVIQPKVTVLAMGGASWARLGSDGAWAATLVENGIALAPFQPANVGLNIPWSEHMASVLGQALKGVAWHVGDHVSRGEAIISAQGLEGGGIYTLSKHVRSGALLHVDLLPDWDVAKIVARLSRPHGKTSVTNHLRKGLEIGERIVISGPYGRV